MEFKYLEALVITSNVNTKEKGIKNRMTIQHICHSYARTNRLRPDEFSADGQAKGGILKWEQISLSLCLCTYRERDVPDLTLYYSDDV